MANTNNSDKWYFTKEQLENTPSRKCGYDAHKELSYRQQAANFIQDMGQRLKVSQLCINTAIVYMHRFYVFHSFTHFPWHQMAAAALFLAAKVEEQPRKLEYVIRVANICRNPRDTSIDINSERYITQSQDLVFNENVLLQTLGFDVAIDHPHTHVVRCCHLVRASKDLAQTSYFMASNSLHLTTMCIQYKPTVVACFCILVACKWSNWEIPLSNEKKEWFYYMDPTVTAELLQQLTEEFLVIFEACPSRLKEKIMAIPDNVSHTPIPHTNSPFDTDPKKVIREDGKDPHLQHRSSHDSKSGSDNDPHKHRTRPHDASSSQHQREREYKERKERERLAAQQKALLTGQSKVPHGHHRPPVDPKLKPHSRLPSVGNYQSNNRTEPRDILREASRDSPFGLASKEFRDSLRDQAKDSSTRDPQVSRSDNKDVQKRDYLLKPNVQTDINNLSSYSDSRLNYNAEKRVDPNNRSRLDISKLPSNKHDSVRRHDESKPYLKSETDNIKKHLSASTHDKNSAYLSKSLNTTSQKIKSPFNVDASKSVPKQNSQVNTNPKVHHNGSNSGPTHNTLSISNELKVKSEPISIKEEIPTPPVIKRPSLFSPEKTPPHKKNIKLSPNTLKKPSDMNMISALSPLSSPVNRRSRNYSSGSEPELRPVMKKIDQVEGFENLMRDNTIGINKINQINDVLSPPLANIKKEIIENSESLINDVKPPALISPLVADNTTVVSTVVNGLETNPTIISNLLKETPSVPHLPAVATSASSNVLEFSTAQPSQSESKEREHHHHKSKKKNKEKHKHKDKDKNKEDKEKKKKHKDKDREKHKHKEKQDISQPITTEPIKIKIHKDKIQTLPESSVQGPSIGLKIKIPKDKIKTESISELSQTPPSGGLKIKIPKEKINNCNSSADNSKKRERDRSSPLDVPPSKVTKTTHKESKQNGRHSYNKVAQMGDGETALHRLAESKYTNKSSSS